MKTTRTSFSTFWHIVFLLFLLLLLSAITAFTADGSTVAETPTLAVVLVGFLRDTVFPVLGAIILAMVGLLIRKISAKYNSEFLLNNQALIEKAVLQGISYAEESAAGYAKSAGNKLSGNEKMSLAVAHVLKTVPKITREEATGYINSMLARVEGVGATGEKAIK